VTHARLAWGLCAAAVAMLVVGLLLTFMADDVTPAFDLVLSIALLTFPVVGAIVASRRPENPIGWLFCAAGVLFAASSLVHGWATYGLVDRAEPLPGAVTAAWLNAWLFLPAIFGTPQLLFLLFPTGRPLSAGWRAAVWLSVAAIVVQTTGSALVPGALVDAPVDGIENPVAIGAGEAVAQVGWLLTLLGILVAAASLVVRFRRADGEERLQLKWFVLAAGIFATSCVVAGFAFTAEDELPLLGQLMIIAAFATIPIAAAIAILRYRLYEIDRVINRALVYAALTATLAAGYLGCVLLAQLVIGAESQLSVAVSTLAMAALFRPARARIQAAVDRRFYRRRYDAALTLEAFGSRLREQLDLDALGSDLRGVVHDTVQPAHVSLWLRGPGARR
jgi:hypothetical protein